MKNTTSAAQAQVEQQEDGAIVIRIVPPPSTPDSAPLVAFPFGLEAEAARRVMRDGLLPHAKIGRKAYAKRADVLALVDVLATTPRPKPVKAPRAASTTDTLAALAVAERKATR